MKNSCFRTLFQVSLAGPLNISSQGWNKGRNQVREMQKPGKAKLPSQVHRPWSVPIPSCIFHWFRREIYWALQIPFTRPVPWVYWQCLQHPFLNPGCYTRAGKLSAHCFPLCFISKLKHGLGGVLQIFSDKVLSISSLPWECFWFPLLNDLKNRNQPMCIIQTKPDLLTACWPPSS